MNATRSFSQEVHQTLLSADILVEVVISEHLSDVDFEFDKDKCQLNRGDMHNLIRLFQNVLDAELFKSAEAAKAPSAHEAIMRAVEGR